MAKAFEASVLEEMTDELNKKVKGNRLVLEDNGTCFGVLMNCYFTGRWNWSNIGPMVVTQIDYPEKAILKWQVNNLGYKKVDLTVDAEKLLQLYQVSHDKEDSTKEYEWLLEQKGNWIIGAEREKAEFTPEDPDPWSPAMNKWRLKPTAPESKSQLETRVRNHLHFMYSFFSFICTGDRYWVSQDWFFSVVKPASNGTALLSIKNIPAKWYQCFYDSSQAMQGYEMLRSTFHGGIKIPKESDSYLFNKLMLGELLRVFDKLFKRE